MYDDSTRLYSSGLRSSHQLSPTAARPEAAWFPRLLLVADQDGAPGCRVQLDVFNLLILLYFFFMFVMFWRAFGVEFLSRFVTERGAETGRRGGVHQLEEFV